MSIWLVEAEVVIRAAARKSAQGGTYMELGSCRDFLADVHLTTSKQARRTGQPFRPAPTRGALNLYPASSLCVSARCCCSSFTPVCM